MENKVMEYEKRQTEVTNKSQTVLSKLEGSYKESEDLINMIKMKQRELSEIRKKLWITIAVMTVIVVLANVLRTYI